MGNDISKALQMDAAKKPHSLDKNEVAQPELYFSTMKTMDDKLEFPSHLKLVSMMEFYCKPMKTNENREKEKDKTEVAQPEVEGFDESFNPNDRKYLENPSIIALNPDDELEFRSHLELVEAWVKSYYEARVKSYCEEKMRYEIQAKEKDKNKEYFWMPEECCAQSEEYFSTTINRDHEARHFLKALKTNENREKKKDKNEVAQSFYTRPYLSHMIYCDDAAGHLEHSKARHLEQMKACLIEVYCEPMKTYENQEKEKDKKEIAQPEDLRADSGALCAMMKTNENREREKDKTEVAQPEVEDFDESFNPNDRKYLENPSIIALNPDDELEYWKRWEAYEKKNENREKDKKEVAQPEVESLDESFDLNDRNYLENPSIIALNPDDELEYWKHWEAYEKKNENREKDKKEVEQPEVLDESFDLNDRNYLENQYFVTVMNPNDEVEYWKHGKVYEKKNDIDDREIEKED